MAVIKFLRDITGLFNWSTDENPTSQQDYQNAVKNWQETEKNLVDAVLWQPETAYDAGNQVRTPSLPSECVLVCTTAGTSGANEPDYTGVVIGDTVADGTAEWTVASYLPTSGGTMTGDILTDKANFIIRPVADDGVTQMFGGSTGSDGAIFGLYGKDNTSYPGWFSIRARDGVNDAGLQGKPDGTLTWKNGNILVNKLNVQVGTTNSTSVSANSYASIAITFSPAFSSAPVVFATVQNAYAGFYASVGSITTSGATIIVNNASGTTRSVTVGWIAINL